MASKGPRSKLDHETRARRQKALESPREPRRPKAHWDHVLEEMLWLSKDFEAERKWKLAQAKKVALRASRGMLDQATRGERRIKEEEQRMRKVALNISKDVKKFWTKIEKLVLYKHQLELDDKKKKALDKQLEYLLGQTERYSNMLAENLVGASTSCAPGRPSLTFNNQQRDSDGNTVDKSMMLLGDSKSDTEIKATEMEVDANSVILSQNVLDTSKSCPSELSMQEDTSLSQEKTDEIKAVESLKLLAASTEVKLDSDIKTDNVEGDEDYNVLSVDESDDDERTIEQDEALITEEERQEELAALKNEVDLPLEELLKRYSTSEVNGESCPDRHGVDTDGLHEVVPDSHKSEDNYDSLHVLKTNGVVSTGMGKSNGVLKVVNHFSEIEACPHKNESNCMNGSGFVNMDYDSSDEQGDDEFDIATVEEKDDETTLAEEEELAKADSSEPADEISLLQKESEVPLEELLARYNMDFANHDSTNDESDSLSDNSDVESSPVVKKLERGVRDNVLVEGDIFLEAKPASTSSPEAVNSSQLIEPEEESQRDARIADAAAAARSAQPTGNTFSTTNVRTKYPFLMKHSLREYQHIGLDWLVTMYEKRLNGILADEMGLGKTIMTIALLAHLACEKGIWGPHLIVVPTSVMLNWETEFLKWCPAFKILTYFGGAKERKYKRQGWMKPNSFHVCITTYRLVIQDSKCFKRKKWKYLILDEAHLIKNWKSQRWQTLLNFNSKRRILLTGTPLQNDLMELWSLMHFLMPHIFQSHQEFKDWFCNPISGMVDGQEKVNKEVVDRLHNVLRPFLLRRLKRDVETQLPMKKEHVIYCRLSKRQRNLYEDFIASAETQATLANSNFIGMLSVIMQLRKVCNHPDLFEGRPIVSSFDMVGLEMQMSANVCSLLSSHPFSSPDLSGLGFVFTHLDFTMTSWESDAVQSIATPSRLIESRASSNMLDLVRPSFKYGKKCPGSNIFEEIRNAIFEERLNEVKQRASAIAWWNSLRCRKKPVYSTTLRKLLTIKHPVQLHKENSVSYDFSSKLADIVLSPVERFQKMIDQVEAFMFAIPAARAPPPACWCSKSETSILIDPVYKEQCSKIILPLLTPIRPAIVRRQLFFPDRRLIQFDCGKLQQLAVLLRRLKSEGHRALVFTQMTKMLDILEAFINLYGYTYVRLDGSTQPEERQTLMQRFNTNPKIFLFILSTRSGGVGINLVGADTVIFYDSDWNPAMDQQAQDRCHRIGQTREVHIYRLVSESTIEENILKKANQKRALDDLVIQSGGYNTEFFKKLDPMELFSGHKIAPVRDVGKGKEGDGGEVLVSNADIEAALRNAEDEADYMALKKVEEEEAVENQEFTEEAIGKLEDEDFANEDATKIDESVDQGALIVASNSAMDSRTNDLEGEKALTLACNEDDVDMIADVKQMAEAAAAAGQEVLSFENQLRPIDRYAIRFLELWDPIIDKNAVEHQAQFEEREWELEKIERLKEDMEAEIDDEDEPLVYEKWDAEFATQAYHQQVEALAQHQLMEEMEIKAKEMENENVDDDYLMKNQASSSSKRKNKKKKTKKAKFKSLKKGSLASATKVFHEEDDVEYVSSDNEDNFHETTPRSEISPTGIILLRKRKKDEMAPAAVEEKITKIKFKKPKKTALVTKLGPTESNVLSISHEELKDARPVEDGGEDLEPKLTGRAKMGVKILIPASPMKRIYTIKPEKLKKKGNMWSSDGFPSPDSWLPQEDAVLCALVHEYGPNWSLVSDVIYGMTAGGLYRGRFRHPVLCCERFRELVQKYVHAVADTPNSEKPSTTAPTKGPLRVTEDNIRVLLDAAMEQPDRELLLQRHFTALLTSVWRMTSSLNQQRNRSITPNHLSPSIRLFGTSVNPNAQTPAIGGSKKSFNRSHVKLITTALHDAENLGPDGPVSNLMEEDPPTIEKLDVVVEFGKEESEMGDLTVGFPSMVSLSISNLEALSPLKIASKENQLRFSQQLAESRLRDSSTACLHGVLGWASSVFPIIEHRSRSSFKSPSSGKHKLGVGESSRSSKSKVRKLMGEQPDTNLALSDLSLQLLPSLSEKNPTSTSGSYITQPLDGSFENLLNDIPIGLDDTDNPEMVPHCYNPDFLSGLDDCSLLESMDIG
ncbi:protein PHOTOPERIOD-INDEPENDENT EARLY FLOWERING 1 [Silene latifolia]|uniref:protein PHOTOPERIOD-INDEPENDENT EARLY FLOWERING 1 n=1 Tax=Silene latifolia TaxID=37657 RepID=UPI003D76AB54